MIVHTLVSPYRNTNNYLIELESGDFIGIDIGSIDIENITSIIESKGGKLLAYFLTHAHGDHTVGIKKIWDLYQMPIYCSPNAAKEITNPRKNFSIYSDEIPTFNYDLPYSLVENNQIISFESTSFKVMWTPGHSPGCIVVFHETVVFTGDFLMKDYKTPLNLPNSNRDDYSSSLEKFKMEIANKNYIYYPGHGDSFTELI